MNFKPVISVNSGTSGLKPLNTRPAVKTVSANWTIKDYIGAGLCRVSSYRNKYTVQPGLYKIGNPDSQSNVLVSANYKLSFDILRRNLKNQHLWILVIDTKGINVWCAAGKGTFGTRELVSRILSTQLSGFINHKKIIVPQLGGPGINAHEVRKQTGLRVYYGPVEAKDIPIYLANNLQTTPQMRLIRFGILNRLVLVPMELIPSFKYFFYFAAGIFLVMGLEKNGIIFKNGFLNGLPFYIAGLLSIIAGAFFTPLFLPFIPFRAFSLKGAIIGFIIAGTLVFFNTMIQQNPVLMLFVFTFIPAMTSLTALQFTGSSTYTNHSGVEKEHKFALPAYLVSVIISLIFIGIYKIQTLGIL